MMRVRLAVVVCISICWRQLIADRDIQPALCHVEHRWRVNNDDLLARYEGNVTVLVTINLDDRLDRQKMLELGAFAEKLRDSSYNQLVFILVSPANESQQWRLKRLQHSYIQLHNDNPWSSLWSNRNSDERDVFVYDRCGRLTYMVKAAHSLLAGNENLASAIYTTLHHQPCGFCAFDPAQRRMRSSLPDDAIAFYRQYRYSHHEQVDARQPPLPTTVSVVGPVVVSMRARSIDTNQPMTGNANDVYTKMEASRNRNWRNELTTIQPYFHYPDRKAKLATVTQNNDYYSRNQMPSPVTSYPIVRPTTTTEWFVRRPQDYAWYATTSPPTTTQRYSPASHYYSQRQQQNNRNPYRDQHMRHEERSRYQYQRPYTTSTYASPREQIRPTALPWQTVTNSNPQSATTTTDAVEKYADLINPKIPSECYKTDPLTFEKYLMYSDRICFEMQSTPAALTPEFKKCCYKGVYLTDACTTGNCHRAGDASYKMCCLQKFIQAKWRCCHNGQLTGDSADEFSRCCYEHLVWFEGDSNCCPKEFVEQYWAQKSNLFQVCMPNVKVDYSSISAAMPNPSGDAFMLRMIDVRHAWQFDCPYLSRSTFAYYYQPPANITAQLDEP